LRVPKIREAIFTCCLLVACTTRTEASEFPECKCPLALFGKIEAIRVDQYLDQGQFPVQYSILRVSIDEAIIGKAETDTIECDTRNAIYPSGDVFQVTSISGAPWFAPGDKVFLILETCPGDSLALSGRPVVSSSRFFIDNSYEGPDARILKNVTYRFRKHSGSPVKPESQIQRNGIPGETVAAFVTRTERFYDGARK
jgi:hypothetical protein